MKNIYSAFLILLLFSYNVFSQSTTITAGEAANVQLPVLTTDQIIAIPSPKAGMMVYDKSTNEVKIYNGTDWNCMTCSQQGYTSVQLANIESFNFASAKVGLTNIYSISSTARNFNITDNGIGNVKTVLNNANNQPNGFLLNNQDVIVFENTLPLPIQALPQRDLLNIINRCQWANSYTYTQPVDVVTEADDTNLTYSVREAGTFERKETYLLGMKAYKFSNRVFTEKYASFVSVLDKLITESTAINLYTSMNINPDAYTIISTSPWFSVNNGVLTFPRGTNKPQNNYGLIYFLPKSSNLPSYRMRIFTHRPSAESVSQYFDSNGNVINRSQYLKNYFINALNTNIPSSLNFSTETKLRSLADDPRVPPPTAGTEGG